MFVDEVVRTAEGAAELGSMGALAQVLIEWKATAAIHADPRLAIELKRPIPGGDSTEPPFVPVRMGVPS